MTIRCWGEFSGFCGCGDSEQIERFYRDAVRQLLLVEQPHAERDVYPAHEYADRLVCEILTNDDLMEHGGSIGGSWLTEKGKEFLLLLRAGEIWTNPGQTERELIDAELQSLALEAYNRSPKP